MKFAYLIVFINIAFVVSAQEITVNSGDYKNLKDISEYNLVFDYSNLTVTDYENEEAYLIKTMYEKEQGKPGNARVFREEWFGDRAYRYEPRFIKAFNEYFKKEEIKAIKYKSNLTYTMKIHTTEIYPGYNNGFTRESAKLKVTISIYETANAENVLFSADIIKAEGTYAGDKAILKGYDFHQGERIAYGYWNLAKFFAKELRRGIKYN
ncbi:hypothetical protein Aeqsu_0941 [Aequorivita sublithincola DSM 14238]|uniref:DUF4468 domain-containing protein n=1 Tax=Aequorivita sublithincola (strain DSM 14238 / LMG 21431 / ACAM 643 / 9-3) TaxID=746697 RepID=I3YTX6_AEQSU|nr:hypothetical protein [Aequorivita sublithincola]AFL80444.1 hypothetical protein Aeqsu_0941 [Aequorivita sublithincola DSM 14238]